MPSPGETDARLAQLELPVQIGRYGSEGPCDRCSALANVSTDGPNQDWLCPKCRHLRVFAGESCKQRGCGEPVVGSSIAGKGYVCAAHNTAEWMAVIPAWAAR